MTGNLAELQINCANKNYDFLILSETHTTENIEDSEILIEGYQKPFRCDSHSRHTGGLCIYVKNYFQVSDIEKTMDSRIWWLKLKITNNNQSIFIAAVYRAHTSSKRVFCDKMKNWIEDLVDSNKRFIIAGDMNIDWLNDSDLYKNDFKNIIEIDNQCQQIVRVPTRITNNTKTLIDYVITESGSYTTAEVNVDLKMSDHETLIIQLYSRNKFIRESEDNKTKFLKYNKSLFLDNLRNSNAFECIQNIENPTIIGSLIEKELIRVTNLFVHTQVFKSNTNYWYSEALKIMKQNKISKYQEFRFSNSEWCWNNYCVIRNRYKIELAKAKNENIKRKISTARDQKSMWRTVKSCVLNVQKDQIKNINFNGIYIKDNKILAEKFNTYFVNSVIDINRSIPNVILTYQIDYIGEAFKFKCINYTHVKNILNH